LKGWRDGIRHWLELKKKKDSEKKKHHDQERNRLSLKPRRGQGYHEMGGIGKRRGEKDYIMGKGLMRRNKSMGLGGKKERIKEPKLSKWNQRTGPATLNAKREKKT